MILQRYYYWILLEISLFFSYIWSVVVYITFHSLSPFTAFQYYFTRALTNHNEDWATIWNDKKPIQ